MSKIASLTAVLMLALAATASATAGQDLRSPDARQPDFELAPVVQDLRSPDARQPDFELAPVVQDLRSPDARPSGRFDPSVPTGSATPDTDESFEWGYLTAGIAAALCGLGAALMTLRRRRHRVAIGG